MVGVQQYAKKSVLQYGKPILLICSISCDIIYLISIFLSVTVGVSSIHDFNSYLTRIAKQTANLKVFFFNANIIIMILIHLSNNICPNVTLVFINFRMKEINICSP